MPIVRLIYRSTPLKGISITDVTEIVEKARDRNAELGVTGFLVFNRKFFLQALEGAAEAVNLVYHKIAGDRRHSNPTLMLYEESVYRTFSSWSMGYFANTEDNREFLFKYSPTVDWRPGLISGRSALEMMSELSQKIHLDELHEGHSAVDQSGKKVIHL